MLWISAIRESNNDLARRVLATMLGGVMNASQHINRETPDGRRHERQTG
jgi:hypothetical protein